MLRLLESFRDIMRTSDEDEDFDDDDDQSEISASESREFSRSTEFGKHIDTRRQEREARKQERLERKNAAKKESERSKTGTEKEEPIASITEYRRERAQKMERTTPTRVSATSQSAKNFEVRIMKPTSFEDSQDICDILLSDRAVVINLEGFEVDTAQRVMDFVSGAVYALNGKLHQISNYIFIVSPNNVEIAGDYLEAIRQGEFEVPTLNKDF